MDPHTGSLYNTDLTPPDDLWSSCYNAILWKIRHILQISDMRNKLPILLALVLAAIAAIPWLRSLSWQRMVLGQTTVPPPSAVGSPLPPGEGQGVRVDRSLTDKAAQPPLSGHRRGTLVVERGADAQPNAQTLIGYAVLAVENQQYITAQISEEGELFGHPFAGVGRYYEQRQGPIPLIHLDMTVQVDSVSTSLVQVCNGTTFWTYRKLPNAESLSKIDVAAAVDALDRTTGRLPPDAMFTCPGLGGLGRLIRGLNRQFDFTSTEPDAVEGTPVWKLAGQWKPWVLARLLPDQKDAAAKGQPYDLKRLAGHLPDGATVYLRQSDYFPLRIDYRRGTPQPRCLLSLKFSDVSFRGPIDSSRFLFTPGSLDYRDRTDDFVRSLGQ
jgi:hypothetical protein